MAFIAAISFPELLLGRERFDDLLTVTLIAGGVVACLFGIGIFGYQCLFWLRHGFMVIGRQ